MGRVVIAGTGTGSPEYILPAALREMEEADILIASERFYLAVKDIINIRSFMKLTDPCGTADRLEELSRDRNICIAVSGDPLMYSMCRTVMERCPKLETVIIPGTGSLQLAGCRFGITMEDAGIISVHGRELSYGKIAYTVFKNRKVFMLCSKKSGPRQTAEALCSYGLGDCEMCVASDLSYDSEMLLRGSAESFLDFENPSLCVVIILNDHPSSFNHPALLPDSEFERNCTPMTKEEIRAVVMLKLRPEPDSTVWDLGAGTGSISVECARHCPFGEVYAVEMKDTALEVLRKNRDRFGLENMIIKEGNASDAVKELPDPDCIFIGGTGGELSLIAQRIKKSDKRIRVVMTAVTLETQSEAYELFCDMPGFDAVSISASCLKKTGSYSVMSPNNAVMIYSFYSR